MIEWLMEAPSLAESLAQWGCVAVAGGFVAGIVRVAVRAHREDQESAERGSELVAAVPFARAKAERSPAAAPAVRTAGVAAVRENYVARVKVPVSEVEGAKVLPFLPRAEREALRVGGWS